MSTSAPNQRAPWILAGLLLGHVLLMAAMARHPDSEQSILRTWLMTGFTPVTKGADWVIGKVSGTVDNYVNLKGEHEQNIALKEQIAQLTKERDEARERAKDYDLLRSQIALPSRPQYTAIAANVIARDTNLWYKRLIIDRGTLDGVKRDMPVVTATGVVGRVIAVGPNHSMVQVITDKHAGAGAMLQESRVKGEVRGLDNARAELKNIPANEEVKPGDVVVTTGLDRIYPRGLVIGTVEAVENDPNAPWHKIIINPSAPVDRVEEVLVLLVDQKDIQIDDTIK